MTMRFIPLEHLSALEIHLAQLIATGRPGIQRDALAMCLGLHGFRVCEVSLCLAESLDMHAHKITPPRVKRSRIRTVPLHPTLIAALINWRAKSRRRWLLFTSKGQRVFPSHFQRFCRRTTREVYGYEYRFHALRHTFAMRVYAQTRDLLLVKKLLGHNYVTSTQVYAEALDETPRDCLVDLSIGLSIDPPRRADGRSSTDRRSLLSSNSSRDPAEIERDTNRTQRNPLALTVFRQPAAG